MNQQTNIGSLSGNAFQGSLPPSGTPTPAEVSNQAKATLGELAFLATVLNQLIQQKASPDRIAAALAAFQKVYSYYQLNGNTLTFQYDEGAKTVTITDPTTIEMVQKLPVMSQPPTQADVVKFLNSLWDTTTTIHWSDGQDQTLVERLLLSFIDSKYTMQSDSSSITKTSMVLFYLSLANNPGSEVAGTLDTLLGEGYFDGAMNNLGNPYFIAKVLRDHIANDKEVLTADILETGLSANPNDLLYTLIGTEFKSFMGIKPGDERLDWEEESRFFPFYPSEDHTVNAVADKENTQIDTQIAAEKKSLSDQMAANVMTSHHGMQRS